MDMGRVLGGRWQNEQRLAWDRLCIRPYCCSCRTSRACPREQIEVTGGHIPVNLIRMTLSLLWALQ